MPQPLRGVPKLANGLDAKSKQNPPDLENLFLHRWMRYCMDRSFETGVFLAEKGLATSSLGLTYHSIALSQLQSRDTVPLTS
jgi:hypothetical protein